MSMEIDVSDCIRQIMLALADGSFFTLEGAEGYLRQILPEPLVARFSKGRTPFLEVVRGLYSPSEREYDFGERKVRWTFPPAPLRPAEFVHDPKRYTWWPEAKRRLLAA